MTVSGTPWLAAVLQTDGVARLAARSPIGGPLWSYIVPAALLVAAGLGTLMLYRHFARREE